jgi:hypothetical protein
MKIFISYTHEDSKFAEKIKSKLVSAGHSTFFLDENISLGETILENIIQNLSDSDVFLIILSKNSVNSNYFISEVSIAIAEKEKRPEKVLVPITISKNIPIPPFLDNYKRIDFSNENDFAKNIDFLLNALKERDFKRNQRIHISNKSLNEISNNIHITNSNNSNYIHNDYLRKKRLLSFWVGLISIIASIITIAIISVKLINIEINIIYIVIISLASFLAGLSISIFKRR